MQVQPMTDRKLKQKIGTLDIVALGVGAAVSISIFPALVAATKLAGPGMLVAVAIAAFPMAVFAVIHAFLGSVAPASGSSYVWARTYLHPFVAFIVAWLRIAGSTAGMIVLGQALVQYLGAIAPISMPTPVIATAFLTAWALNSIGVSIAVRAQLIMMIVLLGVLVVLVGSAIPYVAPANFAPFLPHGLGGALAAAPVLAGLYFGIEAATEMGEELKPRARGLTAPLMAAVVMTAVIYLAVAACALGVLGPDLLAVSPAALMELAQRTLGPAGAPLVATFAAVAIGTTMNAFFMVLARSLMAMGRSGVLPSALAIVHPHRGTPWVATTATLALCLGGLLLPANLVFLFLTVSIPNLLRYGVTSIAAVRALDKDQTLLVRADVRLPLAWMRIWCCAGAALALVLVVLGWGADWRPYGALGAWSAIGAGYYLLRYAWFSGKP
jgi:APA family basic amino acid/polyamine antiporter